MSAGLEVIIEAVFGRDAARTWLATGRTGLLDHARHTDPAARHEQLALLLTRLAAHPLGTGPAAAALRACLLREAQGLGSPSHVGSDGIPADAGSPVQATTAPPAQPPPSITPAPAPVPAPASEPARIPGGQARAAPDMIAPSGLEREAVALLARAGSPTPEVLAMLTAVARARGLPDGSVAQAIRNVAIMTASPAQAPPTPALGTPVARGPDTDPAAVATGPPSPWAERRPWLVTAAVAVLLSATLLALLLVPGRATSPVADDPGRGVAQGRNPGPVPGGLGSPSETRPSLVSDLPVRVDPRADPGTGLRVAELVSELRIAGAQMGTDRGASLASFRQQVGSVQRAWAKLDPASRQAVVSAIIDYLYRVPSEVVVAGDAVSVLAFPLALSEPNGPPISPEQVLPGVFSAGMLARLLVERELPAAVADAVRVQWVNLFGRPPSGAVSFNTGAAAALRLIPRRLTRSIPGTRYDDPARAGGVVAALRPWTAAVRAIHAPGRDSTPEDVQAARDLADEMVLEAIASVVQSGADPMQDQAVAEAVAFLAESVAWGPERPAARRLVGWLDQPEFPVGALTILTRTGVNRASASDGLDASAMLSPTAGPEQRGQVRDIFVTAWRVPRVLTGEAARAQFSSAVESVLTATLKARSPTQHLAAAAAVAMLNRAAWQLDSGASSEAMRSLERAHDLALSIDSATSIPRVLFPEPPSRAGEPWAVEFLSTRAGIGARRDMIRALMVQSSWDTLTQLEADVLAELAIGPADDLLRREAHQAVLHFRQSSAMVTALLKVLPRAPRPDRVAWLPLIEGVTGRSMPGPAAETWRLDARRALVEYQLELVAQGVALRRIDELVVALAQAYAPPGAVTLPPSKDDAAAMLIHLAAQRGVDLRRQAESIFPSERLPQRLESILNLAEARRAIASGPIQAFAAEQVSNAELLGYIVAAQHPASSTSVARLLEQLGRSRRKATHAFQQIAEAERTITRLWLLRWNLNPSPDEVREGAAP
jgi:hypothetical protein